MSNRIEIEVDEQGRLVLPVALAHRLGVAYGTTLVVEQETADVTYLRIQKPSATSLVEKGGIFVIRTVGDYPEYDIVQKEREQRHQVLVDRDQAHLI